MLVPFCGRLAREGKCNSVSSNRHGETYGGTPPACLVAALCGWANRKLSGYDFAYRLGWCHFAHYLA